MDVQRETKSDPPRGATKEPGGSVGTRMPTVESKADWGNAEKQPEAHPLRSRVFPADQVLKRTDEVGSTPNHTVWKPLAEVINQLESGHRANLLQAWTSVCVCYGKQEVESAQSPRSLAAPSQIDRSVER